MKNIAIILFLLAATIVQSQEFSVKMEGVKIAFVADMQNTSGTISGLVATIKFNREDLANSVISGTVKANTLNTGNAKRDEHLKSADFFETETYSTMSFTSKSIVLEGDQFIINGIMKIKNIERAENISFTFKDNVFMGECTIQAANYDLGSFANKKPEKTNVKISFSVPVL